MVRESQQNPAPEKILLRGARQLITLQGPAGPRRGTALNELGIIRDGALLLQAGKILEMGPSRRLENLTAARGAREIDAAGRVIMPGFVDGRTRLLIPDARPGSAEDVAPDAHLWDPLEKLAALPSGRLQAKAQTVLARMARHGTTTASAATIPGLGRSAALKALRIFAGAEGKPVSVIPTLYLAPFVPAGVSSGVPADVPADLESEIGSLCNEWLPVVAHCNLARFVEVDCEAFELPDARRYLECAGNLGFGLRVHAGTFTAAVGLALERRAASVILDDVPANEIVALAGSGTAALLAPVARRAKSPALARTLIDGGVALALASGFGLEHSSTYNMQMVIALACSEMGMSPAEAISAATINGAYALGCGDRCGSLQPGKRADLLMLNVEDYREIAHQFGVNHVHMVVKNGAIVYQEGEVAGCSGR
jgi:imidazolonepropionase